ncbi:MAG: rhodanese-like domain-containing protein [Gammaproteobacteria bacterium]
MRKPSLSATALAALLIPFAPASADEEGPAPSGGLTVKITRTLESVEIMHAGEPVVVQRVQDTKNTMNPSFTKTSRKCPPFCVQPMKLAAGVETIGEIQMLDYLKRASDGDQGILVIDSRTTPWVERGTLPGTVSIPYKKLSLRNGDEDEILTILEDQFGALRNGEFWDFSNARTLVLFCNGMWCGQAPTNIKQLLRMGYPAHKLKWYRGGMQAWETLGLTTVKP